MDRVVCVDGPVAAGKGTLARQLAEHFGYAYLDTGSLYRAVGRRALQDAVDPQHIRSEQALRAAQTLEPSDLAGPELRLERVGQAASVVAAMPAVRQELLEYQRRYATQPPGTGAKGAVLDGRDIGTVVCPDAKMKLFVTASAEARAHRRWLELRKRGEDVPEKQVLRDLKERDERDSKRSTAPLKAADDAFVLDSTDLDRAAAFEVARDYVEKKLGETSA